MRSQEVRRDHNVEADNRRKYEEFMAAERERLEADLARRGREFLGEEAANHGVTASHAATGVANGGWTEVHDDRVECRSRRRLNHKSPPPPAPVPMMNRFAPLGDPDDDGDYEVRPRAQPAQARVAEAAPLGSAARAQSQTRVPEASEPVIERLPDAFSAQQWLNDVTDAVVTASNRSDVEAVQAWMCAVRETVDPDVLTTPNCPIGFKKVDAKLAGVLKRIIEKSKEPSLLYAVQKLNAEAHETKSGLLAGRRILWEIVQHFRLDPNHATDRAIEALANLEWPGDSVEAMAGFRCDADRYAESASSCNLPQTTIYNYIRKAVGKSKKLESKLNVVEHADRSRTNWRMLLGVIDDYLLEKRRDNQAMDYTRQVQERTGGRKKAAAATPPQTQPKGQGRGGGGQKSQQPPAQQSQQRAGNGGGRGAGGSGGKGAGSGGSQPKVVDWETVFERHKKWCRDHVLWGKCSRGPACPHDHNRPEDAVLEELRAASRAKAAELRDKQLPRGGSRTPKPRSNSPAPGERPLDQQSVASNTSAASSGKGRGKGKRRIGHCHYIEEGKRCPKGDACLFLHDASPGELERAQQRRREEKISQASQPVAVALGVKPRKWPVVRD